MRSLRVWIGPLIGLVVVAALVLLLKGGPPPTNAATATASTSVNVMTVDPTTVTEIDIEAAGKSLTLVQKPAGAATASASGTATAAASATPQWAIGSATGKTADPAKVQNLISLLSPLQATRSLGVVSNPTDYGLSKPSAVLKITEQGGTVLTLDVGAATPVGGYYATTGGGKVYIIDSSVQQALVTDPTQWLPTATSTATSSGG
jgi:hypothetical protein